MAASFIVSPLLVAALSKNASLVPTRTATVIAPHLKPSLQERAAASIETVVDGIEKIAESSKHVSSIAADQAVAMKQAEEGVNQISEVVQSNSATAQESSATSEELSAQAICLDELIGKFILPKE